MKKTQKKKIQIVEMHQHTDGSGRVIGAKHPIDAVHENKKTQRFHDRTISGYRSWHRKKNT
jgi:hypothetical protein